MDSIGDAWGFSGKTPIILSRGFSVETLIGVTPLWKTESNRSISTVEDGIPGWLQYHHNVMDQDFKGCSQETTLVLSNTRELNRVPKTK